MAGDEYANDDRELTGEFVVQTSPNIPPFTVTVKRRVSFAASLDAVKLQMRRVIGEMTF